MLSKQIIAPLMLAIAISTISTQCAKAQTLYGSAGSLQTRENAHNSDWAYNWGINPDNNPFSVEDANYEFVPMIWSASTSNITGKVNQVLALESNFDVHVDYVLGFNEPELSTQANMTVETAINVWEIMTDQFSSTDIKLVSPAVSGAGAIRTGDPTRPDGWLTEFMDEVELRNADADPNNDLQVDVVAYHFYSVGYNGVTEANKLIDHIDDLWNRYQRPIWITEFAGTSFSAANPVHSTEERQAFNQVFLETLIPQFDARPYLERVAWWQFGGVGVGPEYNRLSNVSNGVYTPTIIGEEYFRTTLDAGQTYDFATRDFRPTYVHYLKGSNLANNGSALPVALRAVDVMEGSTTMSGTGDFGFEDADDAFVRVRTGATLLKQGGNTVTIPNVPIYNDGSISISNGTLLLEGGVALTGTGDLSVSGSGTLATSSVLGGDEVRLALSQISLNNGTLQVQDGVTRFSEELNLANAGQILSDGNMVVSGGTTGAGSILSTGGGTLFLNGVGLHSGGAQVTAGKLIVANSAASPTGSGDVTVAASGTLGGFGQVAGNVTASGGSVAPGVAETMTGATTVPVFASGVVVDAIDFDFAGVQDDAPLIQTSTLTGGLRLVSGFDFGSGVQPRNAANNGNEFNVAGFPNGTNLAGAATGGDYLTFTIAPVEGLAMVIEDITFELRRNGGGAATQYMIVTSIDGFAWPDRWGNLTLDSTNTTTQTFVASNTGSEPVAEEVEVRIAGAGASSGAGNTHFYGVSVDASFVSDPNSIGFDPTGILELGGNYSQLGFATLEIDLGGTAAGEFDQLQVDGNVALDGTLDVSMIDGFEPAAGQTFDIITANSVTGTFNNVIAPAGMNVQVNYTNSVVSLEVSGDFLLGDVNLDGMVDFADIPAFISVLTSRSFQAEADCDQSGVVDFADIPAFIAILIGS